MSKVAAIATVREMNGVIGKVLAEDMLLLSASIQKSIQDMIVDKILDQLKLNYVLWTRKAAKETVALSPRYILTWSVFIPGNLRHFVKKQILTFWRK